MKLDLIKTGIDHEGILREIPKEILDPIELEFIQIFNQQQKITDKPTLRSVATQLIDQKPDEGRALITELSQAKVLDRASWEIGLFRIRSQAVNKLIQQLLLLDEGDQKGRSEIHQRILELGQQKDKQFEDPINATQWEELTRAEEDEINLHIDWLQNNEVPIKKKVLYAFIATTNGGKTILKTWLAYKLIEAGQNVLYLAQEEPRTDTVRRIHQTTLGLTESQYAEATKDTFERVTGEYVKESQKRGFGEFLVAEWPGIKVASIAERMRQYAEQHEKQIDALIVDYGKLVETSNPKKNAQEWERIGLIFAELKQLAMKENVVVMTSIQLNREATKKLIEAGTMADLYDVAGAYEATTHVNYCWSVRLQGKPGEDIDYNDPDCNQGMYTLMVQKQKYGKLRKGDSRMFNWKTDHSLHEINIDLSPELMQDLSDIE